MRRVKCDEVKPQCTRCVRAGRNCAGYLTTAPVHENLEIPPLGFLQVTHEPTYPLSPPGILPGTQDRQMFNILRLQTIQQISSTFNQSFWFVDILQATQVYPAIWHASLALAAVHQREAHTVGTSPLLQNSKDSDARRNLYMFALKQNNAAIGHLLQIANRKELSYADQETILLASMLLAGLCTLLGDTKQAVAHAQNGIHLFYHWGFSGKPSKYNTHVLAGDSLVALVKFFEHQFKRRLPRRSTTPSDKLQPHYPPELSSASFNSVSDAYLEFQLLFANFIDLQQHFGDPSTMSPTQIVVFERMRSTYDDQFTLWKSKCSKLQQSSNLQQRDLDRMMMLKMFILGADIALRIRLDAHQLGYDDFRSSFETIVILGQELCDKKTKENGQQPNRIGFSFSLSITEILYFVAVNCRDGKIRRKAISILERWPHRDGLWDPKQQSTICNTVMRTEEEGITSQAIAGGCECMKYKFICHGHRVAGIKVVMVSDTEIDVELRTVHDIKQNRPGKVARLQA